MKTEKENSKSVVKKNTKRCKMKYISWREKVRKKNKDIYLKK